MAIVNDGGGFDISVREELFDTVIELKKHLMRILKRVIID